MSGHEYVPSPLAAAFGEPERACLRCGQPEAAHSGKAQPGGSASQPPGLPAPAFCPSDGPRYAGELEALRELFPAWFITPAAFGGYRAEWKSPSGLSVRYVGGTSVADLHKRLEVIEAARGESESGR
jgi:hypothetical protein